MAESKHNRPESLRAGDAPAEQIKVAILGGGIGGVVAAFRLSDKAQNNRYKITIYQRGWRLGGKGASGRNTERSNRIEEHGLHVWFGFYDHAFQAMRTCYEELGRPLDAPLATFEQAFIGHSDVVLGDINQGQWHFWEFSGPPNSLKPGDRQGMPGLLQMIETGLGWLVDWWRQLPGATELGSVSALKQRSAGLLFSLPPSVAASLELALGTLGLDLSSSTPNEHLEKAYKWVAERSADPLATLTNIEEELTEPIRIFEVMLRELMQLLPGDADLRAFFIVLNTAASILRGILADDLLTHGFDRINNVELRDWLRRHGADDIALDGFLVRALYDMAFAYLNGDTESPNLAAGTTISALLKLVFGYKGAFLYKMAAGMGDTVFAPFYKILKRRGVEFEFFHCVTNLHLSDQRDQVQAIELIRQVELLDPSKEYCPLVEINRLPCWPSHPRWEQLKDGERLAPMNVNFEWECDPLRTKSVVTKCKGHDFDQIILAIPVAALPQICPELVEANPKFKAMLENAATTMTQAFQVWMNAPLTSRLGYTGSDGTTVTGYIEPLDTYADMSHLIEQESWSPADNVRSIGYFCGVLKDQEGDTQQSTLDRVRDSAINYLSEDVTALWQKATTNQGAFDWALMIGTQQQRGAQRFESQFWTSNFQTSERYVQTPAGNIAYRLRADESGFKNLKLAGDWIKNGLDAGCVESAVMGGLQAADAVISGKPLDLGQHYSWLKASKPQTRDAAQDYIEYAGLSTVPAPFMCADSLLYGFLATADLACLEAMCDKVFGVPTGSDIQCVPMLGTVLITFGRIGRLFPLTPPYSRRGFTVENQVSIWVPVSVSRRNGTAIEPLCQAWFQPYIWVDNPVSMTGGREIFGYNKTWGYPTLPANNEWSFSLDAFGCNYGADQCASKRRLIELRPVRGTTDVPNPEAALRRYVTQVVEPSADLFGALVLEFLKIRMTQVFLKQFRAVDDGSKAAAVQITKTAASIVGAPRSIRVLSGEWDLIVQPLDTHPLATDLGLSNQKISVGFAIEFDFRLDAGEVLWDSRTQ
jgi:uncharacterized protein with NAD-binding domain and iron-sulfur cluster